MSGRALLERPGLALMRELAILGAECAVAERDHDDIDVTQGFRHGRDRLRALGLKMKGFAQSDDPHWGRLTGRFGMSHEAAWLVLLAAANEAFPEVAAALSILGEDERLHLVTPTSFARLLVSAMDLPFDRALAAALPGNEAERLGLLERFDVTSQKPLAAHPLRLSSAEARVQLVSDIPNIEHTPIAVLREEPSTTIASPRAVVEGALTILDESKILAIRATASRIARQLALDIASLSNSTALVVTSNDELPDAAELGRLRGGLLVLDLFAPTAAKPFAEAFVRGLSATLPRLVVLVPANAQVGRIDVVDAPDLELETRRRIFATVTSAGEVDRLAQRFRVSLDEVRAAARAAATRARLSGAASNAVPGADAIAREILAQGARRMGRLVTHIPSTASFDDLVAPEGVLSALRDIVSYYRAAPKVEADTTFLRRSPLGKGLSCLFSGTPGTGKTFAAQCLASTLGLNLYRIDLSQVVSKYIGETEKSLSRVFEEAEAGHGILLFDEADALFGKRSEVKDAHDRYANVEVAYLLQRMESFEGISILTTNLRSNMDTAFVRRIRFILEMPSPDVSMRRALWERSLPSRERWERGLDLSLFIERFSLSGGDIHNIGVAVAHLAAADPEGVLRPEHLVRATYRELAKAGLSRSKDDFGALSRFLPKGVP